MKWVACELHCHTLESDGVMSLLELARGAKEMGLDVIALTDHNTISGFDQIEEASRETGVFILKGMEWTTFYGHMVTLGVDRYIDWRDVGITDILSGIAKVHDAGGICGMAHPFYIGFPICKGCNWKYPIDDWNKIDYIEVLSGVFPLNRKLGAEGNRKAYKLWMQKLNEGYRMAALSGRDWHSGGVDKGAPVAYLGLGDSEETSEAGLLRAIRQGRIAIAFGPLITIEAKRQAGNDERFCIGDVVDSSTGDDIIVKIDIDAGKRAGIWELDTDDITVKLIADGEVIKTIDTNINAGLDEITINRGQWKWLIAEVYGKNSGYDMLIAFTNPIYFT